MSNEALKPCPFCGSTKVGIATGEYGDEGTHDWIACRGCGTAQLPINEDDPDGYAKAITAWNTRSTDTPVPTSSEGLVAASQAPETIDRVMLGRFVAQYDEGAHGFFIDADEAQEVARQIKAALAIPETIERLREARVAHIEREAAEIVAWLRAMAERDLDHDTRDKLNKAAALIEKLSEE